MDGAAMGCGERHHVAHPKNVFKIDRALKSRRRCTDSRACDLSRRRNTRGCLDREGQLLLRIRHPRKSGSWPSPIHLRIYAVGATVKVGVQHLALAAVALAPLYFRRITPQLF